MTQPFDIAPFVEAESNRITADDLIGGPRTFTITKIEGVMQEGKRRMVIHLAESQGKPFMPCKGMVRLLGQLWGPDAAAWVGRGITLFRDPDVRFGADLTGGVRIAAVTHIAQAQGISVRASQKKVKSYKVEPLKVEAQADKAREAADKIIANIGKAPDTVKLNGYLAGKPAAIIADLRRDRPDLAAAVDMALSARIAELSGADADDDPFGSDEAPAYAATVEQIEALIDAATDEAAIDAARQAFDQHRQALPDDVVADLDSQIARKAHGVRGE